MEKLLEALHEMLRKIIMTVELKIHRQEREIARDINVTEAGVELDAVIDVHRIWGEMDVLQMQIAMAIADPSAADARVQKLLPLLIKRVRKMNDRVEDRLGQALANELLRHLEVPIRAHAQAVDGCVLLRLRRQRLGRIELLQLHHHTVEVIHAHRILFQQMYEKVALIKLTHLDDPFEHGAFPGEAQDTVTLGDTRDLKVDLIGKPAIELEFALAVLMTELQRAEVQKAKLHWLLDFENQRRGDEHP